MKLTNLRRDGDSSPGLVVGDDVLDLEKARAIMPAALIAALPRSIRAIIAAGVDGLASLRAIEQSIGQYRADLRDGEALFAFASAALAPIVTDGALILSAAMNYYSHLKEMNDAPPPALPTAFLKAHSAISGSGEPIVLPPGHDQMVDWEGEFCVVIGKAGRNIPVERALDHVYGYTLMNDVSAREFVAPFLASTEKFGAIQTWERNVLGKNFPTFCPIGPVIVTRDAFPDVERYRLTTSLNGEIMQTAEAGDLVFSIAELIAYYSSFYGVNPGDIISTGSAAGVGMMKKPPVFLRPGDVISVHVPQIGTLSNPVASGGY